MEMPLPASVRRIRIDGASRPLQVALQYRASRVYQLSESEYLDTVRRLGPETVYREFQARLRAAANPARPMEAAAAETGFAEDRDARRELANHWLPLTRLLGRKPGISRPESPAPRRPTRARAAEEARRWPKPAGYPKTNGGCRPWSAGAC